MAASIVRRNQRLQWFEVTPHRPYHGVEPGPVRARASGKRPRCQVDIRVVHDLVPNRPRPPVAVQRRPGPRTNADVGFAVCCVFLPRFK